MPQTRPVLPRGFTLGRPSLVGHYDCLLADGSIEIIKHHPWFDSEIHPDMEILEQQIVAYKRIPGIRYRRP